MLSKLGRWAGARFLARARAGLPGRSPGGLHAARRCCARFPMCVRAGPEEACMQRRASPTANASRASWRVRGEVSRRPVCGPGHRRLTMGVRIEARAREGVPEACRWPADRRCGRVSRRVSGQVSRRPVRGPGPRRRTARARLEVGVRLSLPGLYEAQVASDRCRGCDAGCACIQVSRRPLSTNSVARSATPRASVGACGCQMPFWEWALASMPAGEPPGGWFLFCHSPNATHAHGKTNSRRENFLREVISPGHIKNNQCTCCPRCFQPGPFGADVAHQVLSRRADPGSRTVLV